MKQRSRNSSANVVLGAAGFLVTVGAVVFSVVQLKYLAAAEGSAPVPIAREQLPIEDRLQPPAFDPVPEQQPIPAANPIAVSRRGAQARSLRRVPEFSEMEAKAEAALNMPVSLGFQDQDLEAVLERLSKLAGVSIRPAQQAGFLEALAYDNAQPLTLDFKDRPLREVLSTVYKAAFELNADSLGPGVKVVAAPTTNGIEIGASGYGASDERQIRIYLVDHLFKDTEDTQRILDLVKDQAGGYWKVSASNGRGGLRVAGSVMTVADDDDVLVMSQMAGSIVHLKSLGGLVVDANPQAHSEIVRTLRLLEEAYQVSVSQH